MSPTHKPLVWLRSAIKTPPFSAEARLEAGMLLRQLQRGDLIGMPLSRPMPSIGKACHELRIVDKTKTWRVIYALHSQAIVVLHVFQKSTPQTPKAAIDLSKARLKEFLDTVESEQKE
ncbi:MAG: type II toxin-antitoxin system RelE/ParE family toxin [Brachymonas sp.]|nr:type II toxin-antitoxin system RelE/ParE family toxin [Brachymonas sp.]